MRESFVFHSEYIEDLPQEYRDKFLKITYEYGILEKVPELTGLENAIWIKIQRRIDIDRGLYEKKLSTSALYNKYRKMLKNGELAEGTTFETFKNNLNISNNLNILNISNISNNSNNLNISTISRRDIDTDIDIVNDIDIGIGIDIDTDIDATKEHTPAAQFSENLFNIFSEAGLPCARKNKISFMQTDFKNAIGFIHNSEIYKCFTSQDIERACKNFVTVLNSPDTYTGYKHKINLYSLVQKKWFYELINDNFDFFKIHGETAESETKTIKYHDMCPVCKTKTAEWINDKQQYFCSNCNQYFNEVIYA